MNKPLLIAGSCLLLTANGLFSQITLNWGTSFSPSWSNGALSRTANNINGNSINGTATVSMTGPGAFTQAMGSSGSQTPTVSGAVFTVPGASSRIQITPNFNNNGSYIETVLNFTAQTTNISFRIVDIDKSDPTSDTYFDRVTITGSNGSSSFNPTITKYDAVTDPNFLIISGNTAHVNTVSGQAGNTASDASDQRGTITVNFGSAVINSITIRYDNAPGCDNNPAAQSIAIGNISFSQFTLPVSLTKFSGSRRQQDVLLEWTTKQEYNSAYFEIERSTGSSSWEKIGTVAAAGNSNSDLDYRFLDLNPSGSLLLYRLKKVDIDDNFKYSVIVRIVSGEKNTGILAYPNPFKEQISISLRSTVQQQVSITLSDVSGRTVQTERRNMNAGENNFMVNIPVTIPPGIYTIAVQDAGGNRMGQLKLLKN